MVVRVTRIVMCAALAVGSATPGASAVFADEPAPLQSEAEALEQDLELMAASRGWSLAEAREHLRASDEIGRVASEVAAIRPDSFGGSALASTPNGSPILYIKGLADEKVLDIVESSGVPVQIVDQQPYSAQELEQRTIRAHDALVDMGFEYVSTSVDITGAGRIPAEVTVSPDSRFSVEDVLARIPDDLRDDVVLSMREVPLAKFEAAWGGMRMRGEEGVCTSGWSVINLTSGTSGVLTAGHCEGLNEIVHPGSAVHDTTYVSQHQGLYGDVEWHTTLQLEPARFYADASDVRTVTGVEPRANITVDEPVCLYGRSSNDRDCAFVNDWSHNCTIGGTTIYRLVQTDRDIGTDGDSGGGWSFDNTAYGSHVGNCGQGSDGTIREVFSVADLYDEARNVRVRHT